MADRNQPMQHWTPDGRLAPQRVGENTSDMTQTPSAAQAVDARRTAIGASHQAEPSNGNVLPLEDQLAAALQAAEHEVRQAPILAAEVPPPIAGGAALSDAPVEPPSLAAATGLFNTPFEPRHEPPMHPSAPDGPPRAKPQAAARAAMAARVTRLSEMFRSSLVPVASLVLLLASGAVVLAYLGPDSSAPAEPTLVTEQDTAKPFGERLASTHEKTEPEPSPAAMATEGTAPEAADGVFIADAPGMADVPAQVESDPFGMAAAAPAEPSASPSADAGFAQPMDVQSDVQTASSDPEPESQTVFAAEEETYAAYDEVPPAETAAPAAETVPAGEGRTETVTTHVNLRSEPDNDAAVVAVVPAEKQVEVVSCDYWCEVVFEGQRGWIYKSFISGL